MQAILYEDGMIWICYWEMEEEKQEIEIRNLVLKAADLARRRRVRFGVGVKARCQIPARPGC